MPAEHFAKEIEAKVNAAKLTIVLWSAKAVESVFVLEEARIALEANKLVPARLDGVKTPYPFGGVQTEDLSGWRGQADFAPMLAFADKVAAKLGPPDTSKAHKAELEAGPSELETAHWLTAAGSNPQRISEYEEYLERFAPNPYFADYAHKRIAALQGEKGGIRWLAWLSGLAALVTIIVGGITMAERLAGSTVKAAEHSAGKIDITKQSEHAQQKIKLDQMIKSRDRQIETEINDNFKTNQNRLAKFAMDWTTKAAISQDPNTPDWYDPSLTRKHESLQDNCLNGDAADCLHLASSYSSIVSHDGLKKNNTRAAQLYQAACDGSDARGCIDLGYMYAIGLGVDKDDKEAVRLFKKACDGGNATGCSDLGYMYASGEGVDKDDKEAVRLYRQAGDSGEATGCSNLGNRYRYGKGVPKNLVKARQLLQQGCDGGHQWGCDRLRGME